MAILKRVGVIMTQSSCVLSVAPIKRPIPYDRSDLPMNQVAREQPPRVLEARHGVRQKARNLCEWTYSWGPFVGGPDQSIAPTASGVPPSTYRAPPRRQRAHIFLDHLLRGVDRRAVAPGRFLPAGEKSLFIFFPRSQKNNHPTPPPTNK